MKSNLSIFAILCAFTVVSSLASARQKPVRKQVEQKPSAESEQMKADILAGKGPDVKFYYKGPECLPSDTWQMARVQSPKEALSSDSKCMVDVPKFELSDTKGKKLTIKCGPAITLNYFIDEESCTKFHDGKFRR